AAPNSGVLVQSFVREGAQVIAGQPLFEISTERRGEQGEITVLVAQQLAARQHSLETEQRLRTSQANEKKQAITLHLNNLATEAAQLEQEIMLAKRRQTLAQQSLATYQTLQKNGYVSATQTQQKQEDLIDIATRLSNLQRSQLQLQANQLALRAEQNDVGAGLATDLAQLQRAMSSLQQDIAENRNRQASLITATQAGILTGITNQAGQAINAGQVLATLIPQSANSAICLDSITQSDHLPTLATGTKQTATKPSCNGNTLEVHLYAPSRTAGFIAVGQPVLIRYQAYPYQKFGLQQGIVTDISKTPFAPNELPQSQASTILSNAQQTLLGFNSSEALYRIKVRLEKQSINAYGQEQLLKPGMTLEADVLQDRRKIWEWVLEPVIAVAHAG
ncbi:MAG: HlyD family efflux transporter periplasmic adaptor subunit, partial [Burkholderiales bacterium]|nr:HlyD family efflux transporter periplasmic adaptor subunit [Burkholderiales bacterium]